MTIQELIVRLQAIQAESGDLEVQIETTNDLGDVQPSYRIDSLRIDETWDAMGKNRRNVVVIA